MKWTLQIVLLSSALTCFLLGFLWKFYAVCCVIDIINNEVGCITITFLIDILCWMICSVAILNKYFDRYFLYWRYGFFRYYFHQSFNFSVISYCQSFPNCSSIRRILILRHSDFIGIGLLLYTGYISNETVFFL